MISASLSPDRAGPVSVEMAEWETLTSGQDARLKHVSFRGDTSAQQTLNGLARRLDIREGYQGLEIKTASYVGRVDLSPLRMIIRPKLPSMPLTVLLRYAYGLRDIERLGDTDTHIRQFAFEDLLITMLAAEAKELLHRGLARRYIRRDELLETPRGRVLVNEIARKGGVTEARLPCSHFDRSAAWHLNRVVKAGLRLASRVTDDHDLRRYVLQIADSFDGVQAESRLTAENITKAERELNRLTAAYAPSLRVIRLLNEGLGVALESSSLTSRTPGFLFDMNRFFQRLLSEFFRHEAPGTVIDEWPIRKLFSLTPGENPSRRAPAPRPDFAVVRESRISVFLDAKYRDIWSQSLPAEWLYQLSIYAQAAPGRMSVLLYATINANARDERITIQSPSHDRPTRAATVILRPVIVTQLAELLSPDNLQKTVHDRRRMAEQLLSVN